MKLLSGKKTYVVAGATVVYAVLGVVLHFMTLEQAMPLVLGALGLSALRNGMK